MKTPCCEYAEQNKYVKTEREQNIEIFLKEIVDYFEDKEMMSEIDMYLQERARKLSGDKISEVKNWCLTHGSSKGMCDRTRNYKSDDKQEYI